MKSNTFLLAIALCFSIEHCDTSTTEIIQVTSAANTTKTSEKSSESTQSGINSQGTERKRVASPSYQKAQKIVWLAGVTTVISMISSVILFMVSIKKMPKNNTNPTAAERKLEINKIEGNEIKGNIDDPKKSDAINSTNYTIITPAGSHSLTEKKKKPNPNSATAGPESIDNNGSSSAESGSLSHDQTKGSTTTESTGTSKSARAASSSGSSR